MLTHKLCNAKQLSFILFLLSCVGLSACNNKSAHETSTQKLERPNIVIFYVDDLGYQDIGAYGASAVKTPNIDKLAAGGIRFTDAHSSSATCTPSRYSLLSGEYAFRNNAAVLKGDAALIIDPQKPTIANILQDKGYKTAVVGKWHLGLGDINSPVDWNMRVSPGPNERGFDYSFLLPATGDRVPAVYMEDGYVVDLDANDPLYVSYEQKIGNRPTGRENPELLRQLADPQHSDSIINGISRIGFMQGGQSAQWHDESFYTVFTDKANDFISRNQQDPFFLFFSFHDIHVPRLPAQKFIGKSDLGIRGDAIIQMDYITGQITKHLSSLNLLDNTLIVFTSDNGPVLNDGYEDGAVLDNAGHSPAGPFRGGKYSAFEGGTRVPTILHYPARVEPGVSNSLMSQVDIYASIAALLKIPLKPVQAIDSENHLKAWLDADVKGREWLVEESYTLSLRNHQWKYIAPTEIDMPWIANDKKIESGLSKEVQLYDLSTDIGERKNLAEVYPEVVKKMQLELVKIENQTARINAQ